MYTGIYGKYPDKTYLTDDDKKTLMRSPFFYRENDEPVSKKGEVIASYNYAGGTFEQYAGNDPIEWTETKTNSDERHSFEETRRDKEFIFLNDSGRGYAIRLPIGGGNSALSADSEKTWQTLYEVELKK